MRVLDGARARGDPGAVGAAGDADTGVGGSVQDEHVLAARRVPDAHRVVARHGHGAATAGEERRLVHDRGVAGEHGLRRETRDREHRGGAGLARTEETTAGLVEREAPDGSRVRTDRGDRRDGGRSDKGQGAIVPSSALEAIQPEQVASAEACAEQGASRMSIWARSEIRVLVRWLTSSPRRDVTAQANSGRRGGSRQVTPRRSPRSDSPGANVLRRAVSGASHTPPHTPSASRPVTAASTNPMRAIGNGARAPEDRVPQAQRAVP